MIESRTKSKEHRQAEALLPRLDGTHPFHKDIHEHLMKLNAGHHGETTTDFYLQYLPDLPTMKNVELFDGIQHFQLDLLLFTPSSLIILEVKNMKGELNFDFDNHQLVRIMEDRQDVFQDPFLQVHHQTFQLSRWLHMNQLPVLPIHSLIVIPNHGTKVTTIGEDAENKRARSSDQNNCQKSLNNFLIMVPPLCPTNRNI
ncbi:nuclease-related domain-containing protein [Halobacillus sp. Nhm2S1]|uniref:nuclease-related domain-containing protein n=1 Tax=Halobacillus sp. Nhm2S1 TaxID=2866716 RepID=UPI001C73A314|nr:nuclease-related domain-containing protein [Halobacillus sp. Nhm2S1]MBX0358014.1 NERD domain-containing protein [Halobacillus sp. Nhm2S1]